MIRLIVLAFALILAATAQAKPIAPLQQPADMVTSVRDYGRYAGERPYRRCAAGYRLVGNRCVRRTYY